MEFSLACGRGDLKTMWNMLEKDPDLVHGTVDGWTPLCRAVWSNQILAVKLLLIFGSTTSPHVIDIAKRKGHHIIASLIENKYKSVSSINPEFSLACGRGDLFKICTMMEQDPTLIHQKGLAGWTPLFYAVRANEILSVKLLLSYGADTSVRDTFGKSALDIAKRKKYHEIIELLKLKRLPVPI